MWGNFVDDTSSNVFVTCWTQDAAHDAEMCDGIWPRGRGYEQEKISRDVGSNVGRGTHNTATCRNVNSEAGRPRQMRVARNLRVYEIVHALPCAEAADGGLG